MSWWCSLLFKQCDILIHLCVLIFIEIIIIIIIEWEFWEKSIFGSLFLWMKTIHRFITILFVKFRRQINYISQNIWWMQMEISKTVFQNNASLNVLLFLLSAISFALKFASIYSFNGNRFFFFSNDLTLTHRRNYFIMMMLLLL